MTLPIPVDIPANAVRPIAIQKFSIIKPFLRPCLNTGRPHGFRRQDGSAPHSEAYDSTSLDLPIYKCFSSIYFVDSISMNVTGFCMRTILFWSSVVSVKVRSCLVVRVKIFMGMVSIYALAVTITIFD